MSKGEPTIEDYQKALDAARSELIRVRDKLEQLSSYRAVEGRALIAVTGSISDVLRDTLLGPVFRPGTIALLRWNGQDIDFSAQLVSMSAKMAKGMDQKQATTEMIAAIDELYPEPPVEMAGPLPMQTMAQALANPQILAVLVRVCTVPACQEGGHTLRADRAAGAGARGWLWSHAAGGRIDTLALSQEHADTLGTLLNVTNFVTSWIEQVHARA